MASEHLVDLELKPALEFFPPLEPTRNGLLEVRSLISQMLAAAPEPDDLTVWMNVVSIPGPGNSFPLRVLCYRPAKVEQPLPAILHIHGGGFILGGAANQDALLERMADAVGVTCVSVE